MLFFHETRTPSYLNQRHIQWQQVEIRLYDPKHLFEWSFVVSRVSMRLAIRYLLQWFAIPLLYVPMFPDHFHRIQLWDSMKLNECDHRYYFDHHHWVWFFFVPDFSIVVNDNWVQHWSNYAIERVVWICSYFVWHSMVMFPLNFDNWNHWMILFSLLEQLYNSNFHSMSLVLFDLSWVVKEIHTLLIMISYWSM